MTQQERIRAAQLQIRAAHRTLFEQQSKAIDGLRMAIDACAHTQEELMQLFDGLNALDDAIEGDDAP